MALLAVCDSNYRFTFVDISSYDKESDLAIYQNSLLDKQIRIVGELLPFTFVGDEAFALSTHVQRPYGGKNLLRENKTYNYCLSRARCYIECSFGILTNKWRVFHRAMNINVNDAVTLVKACCALHSFVRERDSVDFDCTYNWTGGRGRFNTTREHAICINNQRKVCAIFFQRRRIFAVAAYDAQTDGSSRYHMPPKVSRVQDSMRLFGRKRVVVGGGDKPQSPVCKHFRLCNARL
ncbi:hypothetical protein PR048_010609 [Dryococelus australis]|uniref:DDE Tnp4 domain-containing protein n=1 Tax=Dryococelus australis TaxID=614101 RepID=A0ABQ9I4D1_9NEOP|nr:hypothetical protein PR048_010609 [Dryococelus australis]